MDNPLLDNMLVHYSMKLLGEEIADRVVIHLQDNASTP